MATNQQDLDRTAITKELESVIKSVNTIQGSVHKVILMTSIYAYKYNDANIVNTILNSLTGVKGSFRVESVAYWFKHIAGLNASFDKKLDKWTCKFCKNGEYKSEWNVPFTFDKNHVAQLKLDNLRFWKVAPVAIKELKLQDDIEKVTASAEIQLARSFAAGHITQEALALHLQGMIARVVNLSNNGKTKDWLEEFYTQHPDQRPVLTLDPIEVELAQLEAEELLELDINEVE